MTQISGVENASLGAAMGTGFLTIVTNNATFITVMCTVCFGMVYASCAIWNAYTNHRRIKTEIVQSIIEEMERDNCDRELINEVVKYARKK